MSDTVERLRASKQAAVSDEHRDGKEVGEQWAKEKAEYAELRRLGEVHESTSPIRIFSTGEGSTYTTAEQLFFHIRPEADGDRQEAMWFWEHVAGDGAELTDDFVHGFAEGAINSGHYAVPRTGTRTAFTVLIGEPVFGEQRSSAQHLRGDNDGQIARATNDRQT